MDIEKQKDGKKLDIKVIGRLDTKSAPELKEVLIEGWPFFKVIF